MIRKAKVDLFRRLSCCFPLPRHLMHIFNFLLSFIIERCNYWEGQNRLNCQCWTVLMWKRSNYALRTLKSNLLIAFFFRRLYRFTRNQDSTREFDDKRFFKRQCYSLTRPTQLNFVNFTVILQPLTPSGVTRCSFFTTKSSNLSLNRIEVFEIAVITPWKSFIICKSCYVLNEDPVPSRSF